MKKYTNLFESLKPATFKYIDGDKINFGVMAQDIEKGLIECGENPEEFSILSKDHRDFYKVDYSQLIPILISEIKMLKKEVESLRGEINGSI